MLWNLPRLRRAATPSRCSLRRPRFQPTLEALEERSLLSASVQFNSATYSFGENSGDVPIFIMRTGSPVDLANSVMATVGVTGGTAASGIDYQFVGTPTVLFQPNDMSKIITIRYIDNQLGDGDRTVNLALSSFDAMLGVPNTAVITIRDNEPTAPSMVRFAAAAYTIGENNSFIDIPVQRTGGSAGTVTVNYAVSVGTAGAGIDYTLPPGPLTFQPGELAKTFRVRNCRRISWPFVVGRISNPSGKTRTDWKSVLRYLDKLFCDSALPSSTTHNPTAIRPCSCR